MDYGTAIALVFIGLTIVLALYLENREVIKKSMSNPNPLYDPENVLPEDEKQDDMNEEEKEQELIKLHESEEV